MGMVSAQFFLLKSKKYKKPGLRARLSVFLRTHSEVMKGSPAAGLSL